MEYIEEGTVLNDRYTVGKLIGEGGMSVVYEGTDIRSGATVALKVLKGDYTNDEKRVEKLRKEALSLRALRHPNIVKVYGIGHKSGMHYIAMEKIEGVTISEIVGEGGPLEWHDSAKIILQVLDALNYTHEQGVIHKDIKPQNILVDENKHATLTDFGIAENRATQDTIQAGENEFSVYYMSPEQARAGVVDQRSDIYSLGVTFYEMLVGSMPFDGDTQYAVILKIVNNNIVPAHEVDDKIPRAISDVVSIATMKDPNRRFQTAMEMRTALERAIENPDVPLIADDAIEVKPTPKPIEEKITDDEDEEPTKVNIGEQILKVLAYTIGVALSIAAITFIVKFSTTKLDPKNSAEAGTYYQIKSYEGYKADAIIEMLAENNINAQTETVESDKYPSGYILNQSISEGQKVLEGTTIKLKVIAKSGYLIVDNYQSMKLEAATRLIKTKNLKMETVYVSSSKDKDVVISTSPKAGTEIELGGTVTFYVSRGNIGKTVVVPELCGTGEELTLEMAKKKIEAAGLKLGNVYPEPGEDLTKYYEAKITPEPTAEPTEVPTETPTEKPTEAPTETPTEAPTQEITPSPTAENEEENAQEGEPIEGTAEPTEAATAAPTDVPTATVNETPAPTRTPRVKKTPTPGPTVEPTVNPDYLASLYVVEQYPAAGDETYEGDTVDLYFVPRRTLDIELGREQEVEIEIPAEKIADGNSVLVYIDFVLEDGEKTSAKYSDVTTETLLVSVPFGWDGMETEMYIKIEDMSTVYEKKIVKYVV